MIADLVTGTNVEQYVNLGIRVLGALVTELQLALLCFSDANDTGNGYQAGNCGGKLVSILFDTIY